MIHEKKSVLILSGGAPNSPLMAGALAAIYDAQKTFDIIYASGAGSILGMLFLAPNGKTPSEALFGTTACAVDDTIFDVFPIGYKSFFKRGPFTKLFLRYAAALQITNPAIPARTRRLINDTITFWIAAGTPTDLSMASEGLCRPVPFIRDVVDFDALRSEALKGRFYMNAYCIEDGKIVNFADDRLSRDSFHAALAFPFIYGPAKYQGKHYYEGSSVDPVSLDLLYEKIMSGKISKDSNFVLMDILGAFESALVRRPRNLIDSYGISIIAPICSLARLSKLYFRERLPEVTLQEISFDVPIEKRRYMLDWSYSNIMEMWRVGYATGAAWVKEHGAELPDCADYPLATLTPAKPDS